MQHSVQQFTRLFAVTILVFSGAAASAIHAQTPAAENPLEARARQFASAVSAGDPQELQRLVIEAFSAEMQRIPMPAHIAILTSFWDMTRGLDFDRLRSSSKPGEAVALFTNRLTGGQTAIFFRVEQEPPHRIVTVRPWFLEPSDKRAVAFARKRTDQQIAQELGTFMQRLVEADVFSGAVALTRDGVIVFQRAYGQADKNFSVPNRTDTKYHLGSMNKMFTAVAIAQLVEQGRLSYDDPLFSFLPKFPDPESAKKIRIKHLLSHTAGLGMWWGPRYFGSAKDSFRTVDDMLKWAAEDEKSIQFEPGTRYQYSNTGFVALGKVVEKVTGQSYFDYVRENIYKRADMHNTESYERDQVISNLAVGYRKTFDERGKPTFRNNLFVNPVRGGPHGGGFSTLEDLLKFKRALRSGKLLKVPAVNVLLSAKPELGAEYYGYGFEIDANHGTVGHSGGSMGTSDKFEMFLRSGWTAIVLSNYMEDTFNVCDLVTEKIHELLEDQESAPSGTVAPAPATGSAALQSIQQPSVDAGNSEEGIGAVPVVSLRVRVR